MQLWGAGCSVSVQCYLRLFTDKADHFAQAARIVLYSETIAKIPLMGGIRKIMQNVLHFNIPHYNSALKTKTLCKISIVAPKTFKVHFNL